MTEQPMTPRERAENVVADVLRRPAVNEYPSDILDDLSSAGFSVVETWTLDHARATTAAPGDLAALAETVDHVRANLPSQEYRHKRVDLARVADQLRAHRCAPAVKVATSTQECEGQCVACGRVVDLVMETHEARVGGHQCAGGLGWSAPAAPPAEGEADDATCGRAAKLPADRADDVAIALRAAMAWWEDPSDEPGSPRRVAIELADEVRRLRDASPAVEVEAP